MTDELFLKRKAGTDCPMCPDVRDDDLVATLASGKVHLQNDADYPGWCVLTFHRHAVEIFDLTEAERAQWIEDVSRVSRRVMQVSEIRHCAKINLAMFGNMVPHLHCHVIPRFFDDPDWNKAPVFRSAEERRALPPEQYKALLEELRIAFEIFG